MRTEHAEPASPLRLDDRPGRRLWGAEMSSGDGDDGLFTRFLTATNRSRDDDGARFNRRLVVLLVLLLLVPLGAGLGTVEFDLSDSGDNTATAPVAVTPTGDSAPTPTPEEADGATSTEPDTPATATPDSGGNGTAGTAAGGGGGSVPGDGSDGGSVPAGGDDGGSVPSDGSDGGSVPAGGDDGGTVPGGGSDSGTESEGGDDPSDSGVSLQATGSLLSVRASNLAPGASDRGTVTYRNAGDRTGRLSVANVAVEDSENGIVPAERPVDTSPDAGELSEAVHAELWIETDSGTTHLYGTESRARPLAALGSAGDGGDAVELAPDETATLVLVWRVPEDTGNEIQSDAVSFDATISLTAT